MKQFKYTKKIPAVILAAALMVSAVSCSADKKDDDDDGESFWGEIERTVNADGSMSFVIADGIWSGTISANNVMTFVCNDL